MADLGVAHLPVGQPDRQTTSGQRRVRVPRPELIEDGRPGERDGVAGATGREPPAVENHQHA